MDVMDDDDDDECMSNGGIMGIYDVNFCVYFSHLNRLKWTIVVSNGIPVLVAGVASGGIRGLWS